MLSGGHEISRSDASTEDIDTATKDLDGQLLASIEIDPTRGTSVFEFDLETTLQTWPSVDDETHWMLYMSSGDVFSYRGDGFYSQGPGDQSPDKQVWRSLEPGRAV